MRVIRPHPESVGMPARLGGVGVGVGPRGVGVGVGPPGVGVGVGIGVGATRLQRVTMLVSSVTAPFRARVCPETLALVFKVMLVSARMLPASFVLVPRVAELPTCQNTLHFEPPLITTTDEPLAVVSVLPIWKTKTASGSPRALRVSVPVS